MLFEGQVFGLAMVAGRKTSLNKEEQAMSGKFKLGVGQAHEIEMAMNRAGGWDEALVKKLCGGNYFAQVHEALLGRAEIKQVEYLIDLDAKPYVPDGWKVEEHIEGGEFKWNLEKVGFYWSKKQKDGNVIGGNDLRKELKNKPVFNANLLDFLLKNPHLIPDSWKGKAIFFWGTIYRGSDGHLYVRCLRWNGDRWCWNNYWLENDWNSAYPAAVLGK